ncbi:MAG: HlyD family efflux transporter periplasmic adaptor subunit [Planctomycetota bacterium]|nr:MAG: HlyD family efflux transporter periplasmic adaptor subunit [Planctomycetota bacterium]
MKTWILLAVALGVVVVAAVGYTSLTGGTPVEAAAAQRGPIKEYIDEEGKTRLAETYLITMPYSGRIEPIELVEGTPVTKGQVVARITPVEVDLQLATAQAVVDRLKASITENDDTSVESTALKQTISMVESIDRMVEAAAARVESGQARLEYAEKRLGRAQKLSKTGAATEEELDQAEVAKVESSVDYQQDNLVLRSAEAMRAAMALLPTMVRQYIQRKTLTRNVLEQQLAEAEVQMRDAEKNAKLATMTSPVDGVVLERAVSNERQVAAGTILLRIGRWEDLEIEADVLSQDVVRVKPGQPVAVTGPAIGGQAAEAEVSRIYPAGFTKTSSLGVEQQRVKVIMKFAPDDLRRLREQNELGVHYRVRVRIFTAEASGGLVIPRSALFRGPKNDWQVYSIRGSRAHLQTVEVGLSNDEFAEITGGLDENEQVILAPESNLAEGQLVDVIDTANGG